MDIVERLRGYVAYNTKQSREEDDVMRDAASEIEKLRDRLADCELSLNIFDEGRVSEYWMRHGGNQQ